MFSLFAVQVEETAHAITISNIPARAFLHDIQRIFQTSRINKYLFTQVGGRRLVLHRFFALELYHILQTLVRERKLGTNIRVLQEILDALTERTWLKDRDKPMPDRLDFSRLEGLKWKPLPFQQSFLDGYNKTVSQYHLKGLLLAGAPGSGKTFTTLALAECLNAERVVIICPKPALERVWMDTLQALYHRPQSFWYSGQSQDYQDERFAVFHYEALDRALQWTDRLKRPSTCVILDESHNFSDLGTVRTQRFIEFCDRLDAQDVVLASGTPIKALSVEAIPIFRAIDPLFTEAVVEPFKKIFQGEANRATKILAERLNLVSYKIEKETLQISKPIFQEIVVKVPNAQQYTLTALKAEMEQYATQRIKELERDLPRYRWTFALGVGRGTYAYLRTLNAGARREAYARYALYKTYIRAIVKAHCQGGLMYMAEEMAYCTRYEKEVILPYLATAEKRAAFKEAKSVVKYYKLKVRGECLGRVLGRRRIDAHVAMAPYLDYDAILTSTTKKTVFFSSFVEVIEAVEHHLATQKYRPLSVYGKATGQLSQIVRTFEVDPTANPLLATYASLSTAVPLVMADTLVMINPPYRDYVLQQTVSRINRLGATTQSYVYTCILDTGDEPNISSRTVDILKWSQEQIEQILQIKSPYKLEDDPEAEALPALEELAIDRIPGLLPIDYTDHLPPTHVSAWQRW